MKIKNEFQNVLAPTWREIYHWIRQGYWSIRKSNKLKPYYIKGRKRKLGIFSKFKDKYVFPIWLRPKHIDLREEYGYWEADFIIGKKVNGFENIITLTERAIRMIFIKKIRTKNAMKCNSTI